jgi:hypothetical protein
MCCDDRDLTGKSHSLWTIFSGSPPEAEIMVALLPEVQQRQPCTQPAAAQQLRAMPITHTLHSR